MRLPQNCKSQRELSLEDFQRNPVWTWYENDTDESLMIPIEATDTLNEDDFSVFFILCQFVFSDKTSVQGVIGVNIFAREPYYVEFFIGDQPLTFSGAAFLLSPSSLDNFAASLGKSIDDITPLEFYTPFHFEDGESISGKIDLMEWTKPPHQRMK